MRKRAARRHSPLEGITPAKSGEAAEVGIVGVYLRLVLHSQGGDVAVGHQIGAHSGGDEVPAQIGKMVHTWVDRRDIGELEPPANIVNGSRGGGWVHQHPGMGH